MTDRLTPGMRAQTLRIILNYRNLDIRHLVNLCEEAEAEAARREAETRPGLSTLNPELRAAMEREGPGSAAVRLRVERDDKAGEYRVENLDKPAPAADAEASVSPVRHNSAGVSPEAARETQGEREGPGSAAAHLKLRDIAPNETVRAVIDKMASEGAVLVSDKPAPAADDPDGLISGLRAMGLTTASIAADRIEAQARHIDHWRGSFIAEQKANEELKAENANLRQALERAAKRFRWYEDIHASKTPPDDDKAKRNREFAEDCEAALARGGDHG